MDEQPILSTYGQRCFAVFTSQHQVPTVSTGNEKVGRWEEPDDFAFVAPSPILDSEVSMHMSGSGQVPLALVVEETILWNF